MQEKLARSRLILQLEGCHRALQDNINDLLGPIISQGHHSLSRIELSNESSAIRPDLNHAWFLMSYRRVPLAWWRIDKCTLDQLASGYYGSFSSPLQSPLRAPSLSEFRLVKRLLRSALNVLPITELDDDGLDLELVVNTSPLDVPLLWTLNFPSEHTGPPMLLCMTEFALGLMAEQPSEFQPAPDLAAQLSQRLRQIPIKATLELGNQNVPVTSLDGLKVGDILPMNLHSRCPVTIGYRPLFYATVHAHDGQLVAKLTEEAFHSEDKNHA
ncbi:FliM/FliN family flagellar motor switch protein [Shewanella donghaensis]|uniref:FliM/FliN family flagellar motor switch protein n=1 Tax=Shewanella donghaensis TaxID=238836 RepID=UPI001D05588A|nr:flagellar motor switch protein FliM [Shewanella donghaensis]